MARVQLGVGLIALVAIVVAASAFVIDQREQGLVLQFGNPKRVVKEPGLHFKLPWPIQTVARFDRRILESDAPPNEVITKDKKTILVDHFTRWRIIDPLKVYQVARTQQRVAERMEDVVRSKVREVLGQHTFHEIVSGGKEADLRAKLMRRIAESADREVRALGVQIIDVRIKRADLPPENLDAVFRRMKAERMRIAKEYRSEGEEAAKEIRAQADKERKAILAEAYHKAEIIRGQADAEAAMIYARAYRKDPEFYAFVRSLEAYRRAIGPEDVLVIAPGSEFFRFFEQAFPRKR